MTPNPIQDGEGGALCSCRGIDDDCPEHGSAWECGDCGASIGPGFLWCPACSPEKVGWPETPGQREQWSEGWPKKVAIYSGDWAKGHRDRWVVPLSEANRLIAEREQQYKNLLVAGEDQTTAFEAALSDTNHLRERAERAEAEVNSLWESLQEEGAAVERVREWAEAVRDRPCGDEDFDHGVRNAGRHVLNLLNTEESK